jgi:hypothetical protein
VRVGARIAALRLGERSLHYRAFKIRPHVSP